MNKKSPESSLDFKSKLYASFGLSILFILVYSLCNYITSIRSDVGTFYFSWEDYLPVIPWLIVPYMSIDLFFFVSPFLCRSKKELIIHSKQISAGIIIAGICFLIIPLQMVNDRPEFGGFYGSIFSFLHGFDKPYNLFPSLHIILLLLLINRYYVNTKGWVKFIIMIWFSLIGLSTMLTYQHHFIDIVGGFFVSVLVLYFIREKTPIPIIKNHKIGIIYSILFVCSLIMAFVLGSWAGLLMLWVAITNGIIASAYFGKGAGIIGKHNGAIPLISRIVLAPYFAGQWLSRKYYLTKCNLFDEIDENLILGASVNSRDANKLIELGVVAAIDMTAEFSAPASFKSIKYINLPTLDLTAPAQEYLHSAANFIAENIKHGKVYVHCKIGYSRSVAAIAAYLIKYGHAGSVDEAIARIKKGRPSIIARDEIVEALNEFHGIKLSQQWIH